MWWCFLTSGSSPWWCRPKWVGRSSVGGISVPTKSNLACMAYEDKAQRLNFFACSSLTARHISLPFWFLFFWVQEGPASTPTSLAPPYSCGPIPFEASPADPPLYKHIEVQNQDQEKQVPPIWTKMALRKKCRLFFYLPIWSFKYYKSHFTNREDLKTAN